VAQHPMIKQIIDNLPSIMTCNPNVPIEMRVGEIDEDGWYNWRPITSIITKKEIEALDKELPGKLPTLFKSFLLYKHVLELDFGWISLMGIPSDQGISAVRRWIFEKDISKECLKNGYIIFGSDGDDIGYLCFDTNKPICSNDVLDYPIVLIEHGHFDINSLEYG